MIPFGTQRGKLVLEKFSKVLISVTVRRDVLMRVRDFIVKEPYDNASCGDESLGFLVFAISLFPIILPSATIQPFNVGNKKRAHLSLGETRTFKWWRR